MHQHQQRISADKQCHNAGSVSIGRASPQRGQRGFNNFRPAAL